MSYPFRDLGEQDFKTASGEAALFELRLRMLAGNTPVLQDLPIDANLAAVRDALVEQRQSDVSGRDADVLLQACRLRNKLLHCEFSEARKRLDEADPKHRGGGGAQLDVGGLDAAAMSERIAMATAGGDAGLTLLTGTKTKTHRDVYGWLLEMHGANEFQEAGKIFRDATSILDRLSVSQTKGVQEK